MPIDVQCTSCGTMLRAPDTAAGKMVKCPKCETVVAVPVAAASGAAVLAAPPPSEPMAMAKAAPAPSRRREEDDDRPSRRRRDEDDDVDFRRRRGPRRDAHETESTGTVPLVLGIISIVLSVIAVPIAFLGCCPPLAFVAAGMAGLGLLLGGGGLAAAFIQKRGFPCPIIGMVISVMALAIVLVWAIILAKTWTDLNKAGQEFSKAMEENQRRVAEQQRQQKLKEEQQRKEKEAIINKTINDPKFQEDKKKSQENLKKIAKALIAYEKKHGALPHAQFGGPGKQGQLSWRVAILPFLGYEDQYRQFDVAKHWNDPVNQKAAKYMPPEFLSPRHTAEKNKTFYQVVVGEGMFGKWNASPPTRQVTNKTMIMVVEGGNFVDWARPDDINMPFVQAVHIPNLGGLLNGQHFNAILANGDVVFVSRGTWTNEVLMQVLGYNGIPPTNWPPGP
jgi:LSD1 subclass zinc finger protein